MTWADLAFLLPEIVLAIGGCVLLLAPVMGGGNNGIAAKWTMLVVLAATTMAVFVAAGAGTPTDALGTLFVVDAFAVFFKLLFIVIIALVALLSAEFLQDREYSAWEYYSLMTFALCGMMFMVSGTHLISIYVGLELLSLSSYILAGYYKNETRSTEAAMKYFVLGSLSSGIMLYGMSLIYGVCGSLHLSTISAAVATMFENDALIIGVMMLGAGLCFKVAAVPFHVWTPDVYTGAPTPVTAFLSTASKVAAFAIFARIFYTGFHNISGDWNSIIAAVAGLSMIVGNLAAITQDNVKRMLAYSSIAHAGYALLGILAMSEIGLQGVLIYMLVYEFANIGTWAMVMLLRRREYAGEKVDDFDGLHQSAPLYAFAMVVFLLSLGGIPPTAGFIGKYYLFAAAISAGYAWLAVIAVLMSAVSMFYYFRLIVAMYLKEGKAAEVVASRQVRFVVVLCLVATLVLGILPERMIRGAARSIAPIVNLASR
ncbi:MAG: NADH-quinone oxidoreductase subunit N [Thermoanaerobaculia bacterium]